MAKRKTIKNNPLDDLSADSSQGAPSGIETLLMGVDEPSTEIAPKASRTNHPSGEKAGNRKSHTVPKQTSGEKVKAGQKEPNKKSPGILSQAKNKPTVEISTDTLAKRVTRLEEDSRMQNILIGIILVPLAVLALLGAAPV